MTKEPERWMLIWLHNGRWMVNTFCCETDARAAAERKVILDDREIKVSVLKYVATYEKSNVKITEYE